MDRGRLQGGGWAFLCCTRSLLLLLLLLFLKNCDAGTLLLNVNNNNTTGGGGGGGALSDIMYRTVWSGYEAAVRPLCLGGSPSSTTHVVLGIALRQLQQLDEPKQILSTNLWMRVTWRECRLVWEAERWNISRLIVPYSSVWTPDLTLYDNADSGISGLSGYRLIISSEGEVLQQMPVVLNSLCQLDVSRFPFDTQTCNLTFGSWAYHGLELNLTQSLNPVDMTSYVTNGEWEVISLTAVRIEPFFGGLPYPQIIFTLVLKRRHLFYIFSMMFPCALIQLMASLAFLLPCETNEKVGLEITVLLSLAVMQLVIMDMIPASSETLPIIGLYFTLAMIVVSVSCMMTVVVLAVHFPHRHRPLPPWALAILRSKVALCFGVDIDAEQATLKQQASKAEIYRASDANPHPRKSLTSIANGPTSGPVDIHPAPLLNVCHDPAPPRPHSDVIHPYDVSLENADVGYSYTVEGERGRRHTYRPRSADACLMALFANNTAALEVKMPPEHLYRSMGHLRAPPNFAELPWEKQQQQNHQHQRGESWEMLERGGGGGIQQFMRGLEPARRGEIGGREDHTGGRRAIPGPMTPPSRGDASRERLEQPRRENSREFLEQPRRENSREFLEQPRRENSREFLEHPRRQNSRELLEQTRTMEPGCQVLQQQPPPPTHPREPTTTTTENHKRASRVVGEPTSSSMGAATTSPEVEEIMGICLEILDCMKGGGSCGEKKASSGGAGGGPQEKLNKKLSRREWEMMAQFLDRVFLVVFTVLTVVMFTYVYATIV